MIGLLKFLDHDLLKKNIISYMQCSQDESQVVSVNSEEWSEKCTEEPILEPFMKKKGGEGLNWYIAGILFHNLKKQKTH